MKGWDMRPSLTGCRCAVGHFDAAHMDPGFRRDDDDGE
jgi:hypothetical protein